MNSYIADRSGSGDTPSRTTPTSAVLCLQNIRAGFLSVRRLIPKLSDMGDFRMAMAVRTFVVCVMVGAAAGTGLGGCPVYQQLPNFNMTKMSGVWYEVERSFHFTEMVTRCTWLNVTTSERGNLQVAVHTVNRWTGLPSTTNGLILLSGATAPSTFRYVIRPRVPQLLARLLPGSGRYQVLYVDYDAAALIYSCSSINIAHSDKMWILGRSREISAQLRAHIYNLMLELQLDPDRLIISQNYNCQDNE